MIRKLTPWSLVLLGFHGFAAHAADCAGALDWAVRAQLSVPVSGIVASVAAIPGARVRAGQELLVLETAPFEARLTVAKADQDRTDAELAEQLRALSRAQELYDRGVLSTVELDHAQLMHIQARSAHRSAEAALKLAQYDLERSRLKAPFDGLVLTVNATPGQMVAVGLRPPVLIALAKTGHYRVRCWVPATLLQRARVGDEVTVTIGGAAYAGALRGVGLETRAIDPSGEPQFALDVFLKTEKEIPIGGLSEVQLP